MQRIFVGKELMKRINEIAKAGVSNDKSRPFLGYAQLRICGGVLTVTAMGSYKLLSFRYSPCQGVENRTFFYKPTTPPKDFESAEFRIEGKDVSLRFKCKDGEQIVTLPQPKQGYPDVDYIMSRAGEQLAVSVDAALMLSALKPFAGVKGRYHPIKISFKTDADGKIDKTAPILLTAVEDSPDLKALVLPLRN